MAEIVYDVMMRALKLEKFADDNAKDLKRRAIGRYSDLGRELGSMRERRSKMGAKRKLREG